MKKHKRLTPAQAALYHMLLDDPRAEIWNSKGVDAPGHWFVSTHGYGSGLNPRTVRALIEAGLIKVDGTSSRGNRYRAVKGRETIS